LIDPNAADDLSSKVGVFHGRPGNDLQRRRLDERRTTSGQPTEPQLADMHALGVRHIVDLGLHTHEKALPDEAASVSRLGMTYIHIPVDFPEPDRPGFRGVLLRHGAAK
jgi:hypothetical protein